MSTEQLDKLRRIEAHCAKRIAFYGNGQRFPAIPDCLTQDAEAGWRATQIAIKTLLEYTGPLTPQVEREYAKEKLGEIIALFPNV